jgi:Winged helix DNA-binding domain
VTERVLSQRELNRATLARQLLLKRARLPAVSALERVAGMQSQLAATAYVGLWTRLEGFRPPSLDRALLGGKATRGLLMRGTVHTASAADFNLFGAALADEWPGWVTPEMAEIAGRVAGPLRTFCSVPRTRPEVMNWLEREHGVENDGSNGIWYAVRIRAQLAHAAESSRWRAPIHNPRFVARPSEEIDPEAARAEMVRRYLAAFGPATRAEITRWSGLYTRRFAHLLDGLRTLRDDRGRTLLDLPRAPLPPADTSAPVRFLPKFDNVLIDRERILPQEYVKLVVRKNADVQPTFTVDGYVAGVWRVEKGRVVTEPFTPLPRQARCELEDELSRLEAWLR